MIDPSRTGQNIIACRQRLGWTQTELAGRLNVTHQAVSKWETGAALPDISTLYDLSLLFGISIELLLTGDAAGLPPVSRKTISPEEPAALPEARCPVPEQEMIDPAQPGFAAPVSDATDAFGWDDLIALAPFSSRDTLNQMISACTDEFTPEHLIALAPFLSRQTLDRLLPLSPDLPLSFEQISCLAPFLSRQTLDRLLSLSPDLPLSFEQISCLAPFLGRQTLDRLVSQCPGGCSREHLLCLAPFLGRDSLDQLIRQSSRTKASASSSSGEEEPAARQETRCNEHDAPNVYPEAPETEPNLSV